MAEEMFLIYEETLRASIQKIDFDDLLLRAISKVHHLKGECKFSVAPEKSQHTMKELRWVLIDEYQDLLPDVFRVNRDARGQCIPASNWYALGMTGRPLIHSLVLI